MNYQHLQDQHGGCGCVILPSIVGTSNSLPHVIKDNCRIYVQGLLFAIDCDKCQAFKVRGRKKPDLIVFRQCGNTIDLLVAEIKSTLYNKAIRQIRDGYRTVLSSSLFPNANRCRVRAIFAQKRPLQESVIRKYRKPLNLHGANAKSLVYQCGVGIIDCNMR